MTMVSEFPVPANDDVPSCPVVNMPHHRVRIVSFSDPAAITFAFFYLLLFCYRSSLFLTLCREPALLLNADLPFVIDSPFPYP